VARPWQRGTRHLPSLLLCYRRALRDRTGALSDRRITMFTTMPGRSLLQVSHPSAQVCKLDVICISDSMRRLQPRTEVSQLLTMVLNCKRTTVLYLMKREIVLNGLLYVRATLPQSERLNTEFTMPAYARRPSDRATICAAPAPRIPALSLPGIHSLPHRASARP
jgi:hypothetical protein